MNKFEKWLKENHDMTIKGFDELNETSAKIIKNQFDEEREKQLEKQLDQRIIEAVSKELKGKKPKEGEVEGAVKEALKALGVEESTIENLKEKIEGYEEKLKAQGTVIKKLKGSGLINPDMSVNKNVLETIVVKYLTDNKLLGEEVDDPDTGIKVQAVELKNSQSIKDSSTSMKANLGGLSKKTGENMFLGGTNTQAVSGQAVNRTYIGEIGIPLTADDHALDVLTTQPVTGQLMTLMVYENYEANGELVAEGVAPSKDSRIELNSKDYKIFDATATATVSKSLLRDKAELVNELVNQLASNLKIVLDNYIFTDGGDNTETPFGMFNKDQSCETFNPLLFAGTSKDANEISVIGKARLQARLNNWATDSTIFSPKKWDEVADLKDADKNSIKDNRLTVDALGNVIGISGTRSHQTTKMGEDSAIVYNSGLQIIGLRQDIEVAFGHNADDLKKKKVSMVMDLRAAYGSKAKKSAIYVDSISEAIAILKEDNTASLNRVKTYATGSDATVLTTAVLINAGVTSIDADKLEAYKTAVAGETSIADLAALQAVIDTVNAA